MSLTRTAGGGGKKKGGLSASSSRGGLSSSSSRFSLDRNPSQQLLSRNPSHVMSQNNLHALQPPSPGVQMDMQSALADLANAIDGSAEVTHDDDRRRSTSPSSSTIFDNGAYPSHSRLPLT